MVRATDGGGSDTGESDDGAVDSGAEDTAAVDSGAADTADDTTDTSPDTSIVDTGSADTATADTTVADTATADTTAADTTSDTATTDTGKPDTGTTDTGTTKYTVGGTLVGLGAGKTVVLKNNGGDALSVTSSGSFTFATSLSTSSPYAVTVGTQPSGQTCSVYKGSGTIASANVTTVDVERVNAPDTIVPSAGAVDKLRADAAGLAWYADDGNIHVAGLDGSSAKTIAPANAFALTLDSSYVYWTEYAATGGVYRMARNGSGTKKTLASGAYLASIGIDSTYVYFGLQATVNRVPLAGGTPDTLVSGLPGWTQELGVDSLRVHWTDYNGMGVRSAAKGTVGGSFTTDATPGSKTLGIAVTDAVYYTTEGGGVYRMPLDGGTSTPLASGQTNIADFAVDGSYAYWCISGAGGAVRRVPLSGGTVVDLATGLNDPQTVTQQGNYVYVGLHGASSILRILKPGALADAAVTATVTTGSGPNAIALDPVTNKIYVANYGAGTAAGTVTVIDGVTNATSSVNVGKGPTWLGVNTTTNKIYVTNYGTSPSPDNTVTAIDGATNAATPLTVSNNPYYIAVNEKTNKVYLTQYGFSGSSVSIIDGATNAITNVPTNSQPEDIVVNPTTNKIYFGHVGGSVTVMDGVTNAKSSIPMGTRPTELVVNPVTNKIYVANGPRVTVIDGATNATTDIPVSGTTYGLAIDTKANQIYVTAGSALVIIDGATNTTASIPLSANASQVTFDQGRVFVVESSANAVEYVDLATKVVHTIMVGTSPANIVANPNTHTIYVTNSGSDSVSVIR